MNSKKTIAFFHPSTDLYGSDKILLYILKNFEGYQKTLFLPKQGELKDLIEDTCSEVSIKIEKRLPIIAKKNLKLGGILSFILSLLIFPIKWRKISPDIVYLNTLAVVPILLFYRKKKKIVHVHEILKNNNFLHRCINNFTLKYADMIICVSGAVKENLLISNLKYEHKIKVVHNGIDFNIKKQEIYKSTISTDKEKINFALIGRIKPSHKGQNLLLDAISRLTKDRLEHSHFYLIGGTVVGQEYMLEEVEKKIKEYSLEKVVTILPFMKDIELAYNSMDVILVPSIVEDSFPTTILEAMFFNKPVIATKVGGVPEMIEHAKTGYIAEREDPISISKYISFYIDTPSEILRMGTNAREKFTRQFTEESFNTRLKKELKNYLV